VRSVSNSGAVAGGRKPLRVLRSAFSVLRALGVLGVHGVSLRMRAELKIERGTRRMGLRAEGVKEFSPGWRLCGTLGTDNKKRAALMERKKCSERRAIKAAEVLRMTISRDVARFLPLLQSGPRLPINTQGSAKPPPWAKFCNRFAAENSHTARRVSHFSPVTSHLSPFFARFALGVLGVLGVSWYPDHPSKFRNQLR